MNKKFLHVTPLFYSIGNAAEEILWAHARASITGEKLNIIYPYKWTQILKYKICNIEIFKITFENEIRTKSLKLKIINLLINIIFVIKRVINLLLQKYFKKIKNDDWNFLTIGQERFWPTPKKGCFDLNELKKDCIINSIHNNREINLGNEKEVYCAKILREYGIPENSKFVCIHVRESGFHNDSLKRDYRNANIKNYYHAINFLIGKGLYVVRMGDNTMQKLELKNKMIIDYPFTNLKSEIMDLFLIKNCEFYIGMQSGILDVAILLNKPILTLNMYTWFFAFPFKKCDRGMLKKIRIRSRHGESILSTKEQFELPFYYTNSEEILSDEIEYIEHTPDEVLCAVQEFFLDYEAGFNLPITKALKDNMNLFRKESDSIIRNINLERSYNFFSLKPTELTRITLRNLSSRGAVYDGFNNEL